jgi:hypothetical protein
LVTIAPIGTTAISPITTSAISPIATSSTIAQTYGFAPAYAIPAAAPITYEAITKHPDIVTGVTPAGEILRTHRLPGLLIDEYA